MCGLVYQEDWNTLNPRIPGQRYFPLWHVIVVLEAKTWTACVYDKTPMFAEMVQWARTYPFVDNPEGNMYPNQPWRLRGW